MVPASPLHHTDRGARAFLAVKGCARQQAAGRKSSTSKRRHWQRNLHGPMATASPKREASSGQATALATTPDRRVPLLRVRAILAPQLAESGRLLGLRETEFGDPLAVGAELIGHAQGVLFVQNWDERKLAVFIAFVFQFGEDFRVDVERRERGSLAVEFSSRGFWRFFGRAGRAAGDISARTASTASEEGSGGGGRRGCGCGASRRRFSFFLRGAGAGSRAAPVSMEPRRFCFCCSLNLLTAPFFFLGRGAALSCPAEPLLDFFLGGRGAAALSWPMESNKRWSWASSLWARFLSLSSAIAAIDAITVARRWCCTVLHSCFVCLAALAAEAAGRVLLMSPRQAYAAISFGPALVLG